VSYGLPERATLSDEELAVLLGAAEELLRVRAVVRVADLTPAWRFSGRWFNHGPYDLRRPRRVP